MLLGRACSRAQSSNDPPTHPNQTKPHRKVEAVSEESAFISSSLDRFGGREARRRREQAEREELMQAAEMGRRVKHEMDEEAAVAGHVTRSRRMLNDMFEQGSGILANMAGSRERIKVGGVGGVGDGG